MVFSSEYDGNGQRWDRGTKMTPTDNQSSMNDVNG